MLVMQAISSIGSGRALVYDEAENPPETCTDNGDEERKESGECRVRSG